MIYALGVEEAQQSWFPVNPTIAIRCMSSPFCLDIVRRMGYYVPNYDYLRAHSNYVDILSLVFDDIDPMEDALEKDDHFVIFSPEQAIQTRDFLLKNKGKFQDIMVHCDAGLRRSTGMAAAIGDSMQMEYDREILSRHPRGINQRVYGLLSGVLSRR